MRKYILSLLLVLTLGAVPAFSDTVTLRIGYFFPNAQSDLWKIEFDQMSFSKSNYETTAIGLDYEIFLSRNFSLLLGFDTYVKNKAGYYQDYIGVLSIFNPPFAVPLEYGGDFDIIHAFNVSITPIQAGVKIAPLGRRSNLIPYVSGGVTVFFWSVLLEGDMIDFTDVYLDPESGEVVGYGIYSDSWREDNKFSLGFHFAGGIQYVVGNRITLQAEVKYFSGKGDLTKAFEGFEPFDLSALFISIGLNYWF